jgi:hypothetical protein
MIFKDIHLLEVLKEKYQAYPVSMTQDEFVLMAHLQFPTEISQLAHSYSMDLPTNTTYSLTGAVHHNSGTPTFLYTFLTAAHSQLRFVLHTELEKKRYKEFSKSFDTEVQSELDQ